MKELLYKLYKEKGSPLSKSDIDNCSELPSYNNLNSKGLKLIDLNREFKVMYYDENPKYCLYCETKLEFCDDIKIKKFCNKSCSCSHRNSNRTLSEVTKKKISESLTGRESTYVFTKEHLEKLKLGNLAWKEECHNKMMNSDFETLGYDVQRKRIIIEQNNTCNRCGLDEWQGTKIPLEIDHKDGINNNNIRDNMEAICPNCHALTDTWRGRNKTSNMIKPMSVTDEQLVDAFLQCGNIRQTLLSVGLAAKGNNYGRVKRALSMSGIDYRSSVEEQFLDLLSKDIDEHSENVVPVSTEMWNNIKELTKGIEIDLNSPIEDDNEN